MKKQQHTFSFAWTALFVVLAGMSVTFTACTDDPNSPGVEYMPDMYRSPGFETYSEDRVTGTMADSMSARKPVAGTVPRGGYTPYPYGNSDAERTRAGNELTSPLPMNEDVLAEGKVLYAKYCLHCHGKEGQADGAVVKNGGHPPPGAYNGPALKVLPAGKIYHAIMWGKGMMGSHASQLEEADRWKIVRYVQTLQYPDGHPNPDALGDITETAAPAAQETADENETAEK